MPAGDVSPAFSLTFVGRRAFSRAFKRGASLCNVGNYSDLTGIEGECVRNDGSEKKKGEEKKRKEHPASARKVIAARTPGVIIRNGTIIGLPGYNYSICIR